jgi:hypothetical protein
VLRVQLDTRLAGAPGVSDVFGARKRRQLGRGRVRSVPGPRNANQGARGPQNVQFRDHLGGGSVVGRRLPGNHAIPRPPPIERRGVADFPRFTPSGARRGSGTAPPFPLPRCCCCLRPPPTLLRRLFSERCPERDIRRRADRVDLAFPRLRVRVPCAGRSVEPTVNKPCKKTRRNVVIAPALG